MFGSYDRQPQRTPPPPAPPPEVVEAAQAGFLHYVDALLVQIDDELARLRAEKAGRR